MGTALISYLSDTSGKFSASSCKKQMTIFAKVKFSFSTQKIENKTLTNLVKFNV